MHRESGPVNRGTGRLASVCMLGLAMAIPAGAQAQTHESELHDFRIVTVAEGLVNPWSIAFLPDGDILVTERAGRLRIIRNGVLDAEPIGGVPEVRAQGQGGLLDVVPHPEFASNQLIYLSFSKPNGDGSEATTSIVRGRFDGTSLNDVEEILEAQKWATGNGHFGSRLAFDRDGYLFITLGDRGSSTGGDLEAHPAQDPTNHFGTTIRLHDDGRVPSDNPFAGDSDALPEIWTYGNRNGQGLAVHPETNEVWQTEHGPQGGDELNILVPGRNYGWPVIGYGVNYGSGTPIHDSSEREGMEQPVHYWVPSIGTSGLMIYTGDMFPAWQGDFFVGGLRRPDGGAVVRLTIDGHRVVSEEMVLQGNRIRDIRQAPDGSIYLAIDDRGGDPSSIVRLEAVDQG